MEISLYSYDVEIEKEGFKLPTGTFYGILTAKISVKVPIGEESFSHAFGSHNYSIYDVDSSCYEIEQVQLLIADDSGEVSPVSVYEPTADDAKGLFLEARQALMHDLCLYSSQGRVI